MDVGGNQLSLISDGEMAVAVSAAGAKESSGFSDAVAEALLVPWSFIA